MQTVFTTGQVAKMCMVAPRTVSKWFDSGHLKGYRIPGSQDRRIPAKDLKHFLEEHDWPIPPQLLLPHILTAIPADSALLPPLQRAAKDRLHLVSGAVPAFDRGMLIKDECIRGMIADCSDADSRTYAVTAHTHRPDLVIIGLHPRNPAYDVLDLGFSDAFLLPADMRLVTERLLTLLQRQRNVIG